MTLVLVQFDFDYRAKDGRLVSIKPNESYILVSKTNEHWWHVRRDQSSRPFYVPAQYVKEVPPERGPKITVNVPSPQGASEGGCRLSTHGFGWDAPETDRPEQTSSSAARLVDEEDGSSSFSSQQNGSLELYAKPVPGYRKQSEGSLHDEDMEFPPPPDLPELDLEPEANLPECDEMMELPESGPNPPPRCRAAAEGSSTELFSDQVRFPRPTCFPVSFVFFLRRKSGSDAAPAGVAVSPANVQQARLPLWSFKHRKIFCFSLPNQFENLHLNRLYCQNNYTDYETEQERI